MKVCVLSDIHANLTALRAVVAHCREKHGELPIIHLGDVIDYCMRPNETIRELRQLQPRMLANIRGNHEMAFFGVEAERFSSPRGRAANEFTKQMIGADCLSFIERMTIGVKELTLDGRRIMCVHGDASDLYWGKMKCEEMSGTAYVGMDFVLSGHTHVPHLKYVCDKNTGRRTVFVNPGSVGQPRNCNPHAQYAVVDLESAAVSFESVAYDVKFEQSLFTEALHPYYRDRLERGI